MKKFTILSVFITLIFLCNSINAQKIKMYTSKGIWEFGGSIYYSNTTPISNGYAGGAFGELQFQPVIGYFIHKGLEIGIEPSISAAFMSGYSYTNMALYFAPEYNFYTKTKIYPVIVGLVGYTSSSSSDPNAPAHSTLGGFSWGFRGGIKVNLLGNSLLLIQLQYIQTTLNKSGATARTGNNTMTFGAGWNVFF